jgi:MerR family regulatory protein
MDQEIPSARVRIGELGCRVGVSEHVLRAWERRYGLLRPERSPGGYRLTQPHRPANPCRHRCSRCRDRGPFRRAHRRSPRLARQVPLTLAGAGATRALADQSGARLLTADPVTEAQRLLPRQEAQSSAECPAPPPRGGCPPIRRPDYCHSEPGSPGALNTGGSSRPPADRPRPRPRTAACQRTPTPRHGHLHRRPCRRGPARLAAVQRRARCRTLHGKRLYILWTDI